MLGDRPPQAPQVDEHHTEGSRIREAARAVHEGGLRLQRVHRATRKADSRGRDPQDLPAEQARIIGAVLKRHSARSSEPARDRRNGKVTSEVEPLSVYKFIYLYVCVCVCVCVNI